MTLIFPVFDRIELLPRFLKYYAFQGITRFVCGLFQGAQSPLYRGIQKAGWDYDLDIRPSTMCPREAYCGRAEAPGMNLIRQEFVRPDEWFAFADLDEFIVPREPLNLPALAAKAASDGFTVVHGQFVDRFAADGSCPPIQASLSLDQQFPIGCKLTEVCGSCVDKMSLIRGDMEVSSGHHRIINSNVLWKDAVEVHHFKWSGGALARTLERAAAYKALDLPWYATSAIAAEKLKSGRVNLGDPRLDASKARHLPFTV